MNHAQSTMAILVVSALATTAALAAEKLIEDTPKAIDGIETMCDGITIANRNDAKWKAYSLRLEFAGKGGQYLGAVRPGRPQLHEELVVLAPPVEILPVEGAQSR